VLLSDHLPSRVGPFRSYSPLHYIRALSLQVSMAPAAHNSDSNDSDVTVSPRRSKTQAESPEAQSDHSGPEESEDSEVYEIETILDAKRGATGSVRLNISWEMRV
jgi:hypothetical protein